MGSRRRWAWIGGIGLAVLLLAGCSGEANQPPTTGSTPPSTTAATSSSAGPTATSKSAGLPAGITPAPVPTAVTNNVEKRKTVQITKCQARPGGGWMASGTARNTGSTEQTYRITIFFTTTSATFIASADTTVKVAAGKTEQWSAGSVFKNPEAMLCVLRGVG